MTPFLVFSQADAGVSLPQLLRSARTHFSASVDVIESRDGDGGSLQRLLVECESLGVREEFAIRSRPRVAEDLERAERAELEGRAAGMASLAARCPTVLEVCAPDTDEVSAGVYLLCGMLASVTLGPVLPPDGATLYGVRGAMQRADAAGGRAPLSRGKPQKA